MTLARRPALMPHLLAVPTQQESQDQMAQKARLCTFILKNNILQAITYALFMHNNNHLYLINVLLNIVYY